jgi:hypothetical protein
MRPISWRPLLCPKRGLCVAIFPKENVHRDASVAGPLTSEACALEKRFSADEWKNLTAEERIRGCRLIAEEAEKFAATEHTDAAQYYLKLAKQWTELADEMQAQNDR